MRKLLVLALVTVLALGILAACGNGNETANTDNESANTQSGTNNTDTDTATPDSEQAKVEGEITVLTNRTDIVDSVFKEKYLPRFNEKYPDVKVNFEAIKDYEGQVKIRLNTTDYGDVLLIPNDIVPTTFPDFFEPLGTVEELSQKFLFPNEKSLDGQSYGLPIVVNAQGIVYNKKIFNAAGVTQVPKSPEEFIEAMKKVKANTDSIPYYTNYKDGWPLDQWESNRLSIAGDPDFANIKLPVSTDPFAPGKPHYILYKMMYDLAKEGLIEEDPTTTDWESSKGMLASGEISAMVLGSWAISQVQALAEDPADIGYMPFPSNINGKVYSASGGDYKIAINKNSKNKEAAKAWMFWFLEESGYAADNAGISPVKGAPMPDSLSAFQELGVEFISDTPAKVGQEGWADMIDQKAEIGFWKPDFKRRVIEAAVGNKKESFEDIAKDLNERWNKAMKEVTGQ